MKEVEQVTSWYPLEDTYLDFDYDEVRQQAYIGFRYVCECGRSIAGNESFCPDCGEKLSYENLKKEGRF